MSGSTLKGEWRTNGTGTFSDSSDLNAVYTPSAVDTSAGTIRFILRSVGPCFPKSDTMIVNFTPAPVVEAGEDINVCAANPTAQLNGSVTISLGGKWSGGNGTFSNVNSLSSTYTPTGNEINSGSVKLFLTSVGNGDCIPEKDSMKIIINPAPIVDAGEDVVTCFNDLDIQLAGKISGGTTTGRWSTDGTGTFAPNDSTLNAVYNASAQDSINGTVVLILTSTNNGTCDVGMDTMVINIFGVGTSSAGSNDTTLCANNAVLQLNGSVSGEATGAVWSTNGSGAFSPNNTALNATYTPSPEDISLDSITLRLTANSCDQFTDSFKLYFSAAPVVDAGDDISTCVDDLTVGLNGSVSGATSTGVWDNFRHRLI